MKKSRINHLFALIKYLDGFGTLMIISIVVGFIYRILPVISSFLLSYIIGNYSSGGNTEHFNLYFALIFMVIILLSVGRYADTWFSHDLAYKILAVLRTKLYDKIEELSPSFQKDSRSGNILSIMMDDVNILEWFYAHTFGVLFITLLTTSLILAFLYYLHPFLSVAILFWIFLLILVYFIFQGFSEKNGEDIRKNLGDLESEVADGIQGIKEIMALNFQEGYKEKVNFRRKVYEKSYFKDSYRRGGENTLHRGISILSSLSMLLITASLIKSGVLEEKWYLVTVVLSSCIWGPISEFLSSVGNLGLISAAAGRVLEILKKEPSVHDNGKEMLLLEQNFEIFFDEITFSYPSEEKKILEKVNFTLREGETVAIAGVSGGGKSTVVHLLQRFYDLEEGSIQIGGKNIQNYTLTSLRDAIAVVSQDVYLFHTSILENIKISKPSATIEEIMEVVKLSGGEELIAQLPQGLNTIVGEGGSRLSGGQKQRIAIARALLKESKILILDEASSNLDNDSESLLMEGLQKGAKERTTIVIAHRLSMLQMVDNIVFLEKGKVKNIGTFSELVEKDESFCEMIGALPP